MTPVVTPAEMRAVDDAAPESLDVLIGRAGAAVARHAIVMLGGSYGRTVHVLAGTGNNGADGRDAASRLRRRGVRVRVFDTASLPATLPPGDLVIDAAYGTGFTADRIWMPPRIGDAPVLAVDIPSGVDGVTGRAVANALPATRTVTFQALKPGLLFADGPALAGDVHVADIGLVVAEATAHLVSADDVAAWWPTRATDAHKWRGAVKVVAGSAEMPGAAELCTAAAMRGGSGLVSLASPGTTPNTRSEVVQQRTDVDGFAAAVAGDMSRYASMVIGPGLGRAAAVVDGVRELVANTRVPMVIDGDAIAALGTMTPRGPAVVTPHDGEFETLSGHRPNDDRIADVRALAADRGVTVLLKGPTTVVAAPDGEVLVVDHGDERLATAGSGDVLSGLIGAALARGVDPLRAAASAAWIHADAARRCSAEGMLAGDIIDAVPAAIGALR